MGGEIDEKAGRYPETERYCLFKRLSNPDFEHKKHESSKDFLSSNVKKCYYFQQQETCFAVFSLLPKTLLFGWWWLQNKNRNDTDLSGKR